ncbi:MAG: hypothetical protein HAW62_06110, partial [Endozoicomonadaceae bacterium]|nr:hypothetical protein [Endozoicomonadaceae bacterium]
ILLAKHWLLLAYQNGHIETLKSVFKYIQTVLKREELNAVLREKLLKILFYTDSQHRIILKI